jgi:hypothetical protein
MALAISWLYDDRRETLIIESSEEYDDSPWTREELQALAWEAAKHAEWEDADEDMDEYDDVRSSQEPGDVILVSFPRKSISCLAGGPRYA